MPVTRYIAPAQTCSSTGDPHYILFDGFAMDHQGTGAFYLFDSPQLTIQTFPATYNQKFSVNKAVAIRYGESIVVLDVTNDHLAPVKTVKADQNMTGMVITAASENCHDHVITLPCGSSITLAPRKNELSTYVNVHLALSAGYPAASGGLCNRKNSDNILWKRDGTSVGRDKVDDFANSWKVPDNENLFEILPAISTLNI